MAGLPASASRCAASTIATIAAGGGSIASVDSGGIFHVGPQSAGAMPGPACYGQGGTARDRHRRQCRCSAISIPAAFMGGKRPLDTRAAEAAVDWLAATLKITRDEAAAGIFRLVNLRMADGIRLMTLRRGVDPRRFALLSFGGAAGLHAAEVARELELTRIIVPTTASVLSAWGMLTSDLRYEVSRTHFETGARSTAAEVRDIFAELETRARRSGCAAGSTGRSQVERSAEMRYGEQIFEIDVPLDGIDLNSPSLIAEIEDRFHRRHEELYTYASRDQEVVFVNARVAAIGAVAAGEDGAKAAASTAPCKPRGKRKAFFGAWRDVPMSMRSTISSRAMRMEGPAIVEAETTTVVINAGDRLTVNALGWLDIRVSKRRATARRHEGSCRAPDPRPRRAAGAADQFRSVPRCRYPRRHHRRGRSVSGSAQARAEADHRFRRRHRHQAFERADHAELRGRHR